MQTVDWSRFDLEGWLYQFYAWSDGYTASACAMVKVPIAKKMTQKEREWLLAEYLLLEEERKPSI